MNINREELRSRWSTIADGTLLDMLVVGEPGTVGSMRVFRFCGVSAAFSARFIAEINALDYSAGRGEINPLP